MAEHRYGAENRGNDHEGHEELIRRELERERRRERIEERRVSRAIRLSDFVAILMVIATGLSAWATWRTAQVTSLVFATADRPFVGVAKVEFEATDSPQPFIAVDYRNFGKIPAVDGLVSVTARIDGKVAPDPMPDSMSVAETGGIPPELDHFIYRHLTADAYKQIVAGKANLQVGIRIVYKGPASDVEYCHSKRFVYDYRTATFRPSGGTDKCKSNEVF